MAKLNIAERRLPQDGRIMLRVQGKELDLRVSTVPTAHGESVVMRMLDREPWCFDFQQARLHRRVPAAFQKCWSSRTASCWSPARPAPARPPRCTPR
jgi:general secretion pathway protein E